MSIPFVYLSCTTPNDINVPDFLFKAPLFRISMDCWLLVLDGDVENPNQIVVKRLLMYPCQSLICICDILVRLSCVHATKLDVRIIIHIDM